MTKDRASQIKIKRSEWIQVLRALDPKQNAKPADFSVVEWAMECGSRAELRQLILKALATEDTKLLTRARRARGRKT